MERECECCRCRKRFVAHRLVNGKAGCPHCGAEALIMLHICPEYFDALKAVNPIKKPYKCPVCNGRGRDEDGECPACKGTAIVWG
jgi:hypothetical protein